LKPGSVIIGTTSKQAHDPTPDLYDYAQTKAATMNYIRSLGKQLAPKGIRVCGVALGPIWTPLQVSGGATMEKLEKFGSMSSMGRPGQPAALGSIYVQLASSDASYTTARSTVPPEAPGSRNSMPAKTAIRSSLERYRAKRDFSRTNEPEGAIRKGGPAICGILSRSTTRPARNTTSGFSSTAL
jgi:hypothetical protein